ncbi:hypothetical protein TrST_g160 [Triparma strigata]|uniref:Uncharacterized protein n=1 Tax=Triparma strigata TaxID=1606541 RepID=A0A9W7C0E4_9STRA|nr:hypothetical protein TrST_g160 [Triparma strigata]
MSQPPGAQAVEKGGRRMTVNSLKTLGKIEELEAELDVFVKTLQKNYKKVRSHVSSAKELLSVKSAAAQFNGSLEKFQYVKVDSIVTADLRTGKEEAKQRRKKMNKQCEKLREGVKDLLEELESRLLNMEPQKKKTEVECRDTGGSLASEASSKVEPPPPPTAQEEVNPQAAPQPEAVGMGFMDNLADAQVELNLLYTAKQETFKPIFKDKKDKKKGHQPKIRSETGLSQFTARSSLDSLMDEDYGSSSDTDVEEMDGTTIKPEWDDIKTFVKLYSPDKASCKRYEVGMASANIKVDMKVLEFLYTPTAHANCLRLGNRVMQTAELDLLGRLFSTQWHHACKLREFYLDGMSIRDKDIKCLAKYLPDFETLEVLSLKNNLITDTGASILADALVKVRTLRTLCLDGNKIRTSGVVAISETISRLPDLQVLSLSHNKIGDYGAYALAAALTSRTPMAYDWEPEVPSRPPNCLGVKLCMGRETSAKARGIEIAQITASRMNGTEVNLGGRRRSSVEAPKRGTVNVHRMTSRVSFLEKQEIFKTEGEKKKIEPKKIVVAANSSLPQKRVSKVPPPKMNPSDKVPVVARASAKRVSTVLAPPGQLQLSRKGGRGGDTGFLDMVVEDDVEEDEHSRVMKQALKRETRILSSPKALQRRSMAQTDKEKYKNLTAKERVALKKNEREKEANEKRKTDRTRNLWNKLRFWACVIGRLAAVKRGSVPVAVLNFANCGIGPLGIQWIMHACKFNESVATINLSDNQLSFESAIIIAEYLMWSETIDEIILDGNEIDDKGMQVLLEGIEENKSLSSLSMDRCNLGPVSLNWIASTAQSYYIDNINLVRDTGIKSANEKLETYTDVIENMGGFVDNLEDKLLELKEEEEGLY